MRPRTRWAATVAAVNVTLAVLAAATAGPASATVAADPPMGLMLQLSSLAPTTSPTTLRTWLEDVRRDHHDSSKPGYINSIVLQDIADANGALYTSYLDVLAPYLPGGATPAFARAYVGTVDLPWTGSGSKYLQGIENSAFRAQNLKVSLAAARAFHVRYPKVSASWYVTYEANLSGFWDANLVSAYRSYLAQLTTSLTAVAPSREILWSPAFWTMYADEPAWAMPGLKADLTELFSGLPTHLTLNVQDFVGQSGGASTAQSAVSWIDYLKKNWSGSLAKVQVDVEQFTQSGAGAMTAGSATALPTREAYYRNEGIELGAAWEFRYWHARLYH